MLTIASRLFLLNGSLRKLVLCRWTWAHNRRVQSCERYWRWRAHCKWEVHCWWPRVGTSLNISNSRYFVSCSSCYRKRFAAVSIHCLSENLLDYVFNPCTLFCTCCRVQACEQIPDMPMKPAFCKVLSLDLASCNEIKAKDVLLKNCAASVFAHCT